MQNFAPVLQTSVCTSGINIRRVKLICIGTETEKNIIMNKMKFKCRG